MKELTIEQKAERYDEAIKKAKDMLNYKEVRQEDMEYLFPELKESEDEKIKELIYNLLTIDTSSSREIFSIYGKSRQDVIAWLEKQGEQKPAEWSEEDERKISVLDALCDDQINGSASHSTMYMEMHELKDWLKSLKDRVQPKQEWSEDDSMHLTNAILAAEKEWGIESCTSKWLKSLRPQKQWKPSKEQLDELREALAHIPDEYDVPSLTELFEQLKQL